MTPGTVAKQMEQVIITDGKNPSIIRMIHAHALPYCIVTGVYTQPSRHTSEFFLYIPTIRSVHTKEIHNETVARDHSTAHAVKIHWNRISMH